MKLLIESPVVITLLGLIGRAISLAERRGPFYKQEWATLLTAGSYRRGTITADIAIQRAILLGLRRKEDRRHDEALALLRGNLINIIVDWHLSLGPTLDSESDLAPESQEETAARLFARLKKNLTESMSGERIRLKISDQLLLARGHAQPLRTAVDLWDEHWIDTGAATLNSSGAICENILTENPFPKTGGRKQTPHPSSTHRTARHLTH